jgi:hypothetical protein
MPLASFRVGRIVPEGYHSYGRFVIDTSLNRQDEILALLLDGDMRRIGVELGVIPRLYYPYSSITRMLISVAARSRIGLCWESIKILALMLFKVQGSSVSKIKNAILKPIAMSTLNSFRKESIRSFKLSD